MPQKEANSRRVTLYVMKGVVNVERGLIDLEASINLMPLSVVKNIGDLEFKKTRMSLQLED